MKLSRDAWLMIFLLIVLLAILVIAGSSSNVDLPSLSSLSSAQDGAKALDLWLPKLGFSVNSDLVYDFAPPTGVDTVLMLEPFPVAEDELKTLDTWVEAGGTLIISSGGRLSGVASHYGFSTSFLANPPAELVQSAPLHTSPVLTSPIDVQTYLVLTSQRDDYVAHLATPEGAVIVSFARGRGRVALASSSYIFTNLGLKNDANAALVLNLLALAKPKSTVWFDEWHHGMIAAPTNQSVVGPGDWLRHTPIGNALLFIFGAIFVGLLLQGRAFGRPVPLPREIKRRGVIEHVTAIANLNRRAGHRSDVLRQYHQQLKRRLGRRYRIDPSLPDAEYVDTLKKFNPTIDHEALLNLLHGLSMSDVSEADMVRLAAEAAQWIKE